MSEQNKSDGLLIGILVVLVFLAFGAVGVFGLGYFRMTSAVMQERDMAEMMRQDALRQAEAARAEAEAAQARTLNSLAPAGAVDQPDEPEPSSDRADPAAEEPQP